mgnify:CR=1 FL=1
MTSMQEIAEFWDKRPCNVRHSKKEPGTLGYFDEVTTRRYFVESHIPAFAQFPRWKGKRVFEIGCGIGTDAESFMSHGAIYAGCDVSKESVALAEKRRDLNGLTGSFVVSDGLRALDRLENIDLIYSFGVLHHTPDIEKIIAKAKRALQPRGELRIMLYAANSWKAAMIEAGLDQPEAQSGCPLAKSYTQDEVRTMLKDWSRVDIEQTHIFPYRIPEYVNHRYVKQPWFEQMPDAVFRALEKKFGWHLLIAARP